MSTGGKPPVQIREEYIIEEAPSHDGTPCFTAWIKPGIVEVPQGWSASDFPVADERPQWSLQIYDTTPQSDDAEHLRSLARALHQETREERESYGRGAPDRIDVWGMPLSVDVSDEERVAKCKGHSLAEAASRNTAENPGFSIPRLCIRERWQRGIVIIDRTRELWNEEEGGFLVSYWDSHPTYLKQTAQSYGKDHASDSHMVRYTRDELGGVFANMRTGIESL